jgi:hypothetical protein
MAVWRNCKVTRVGPSDEGNGTVFVGLTHVSVDPDADLQFSNRWFRASENVSSQILWSALCAHLFDKPTRCLLSDDVEYSVIHRFYIFTTIPYPPHPQIPQWWGS